MSPGGSFYQCFQNGVDVIEFQFKTPRQVSPTPSDLGQHWATTLLSIFFCIGCDRIAILHLLFHAMFEEHFCHNSVEGVGDADRSMSSSILLSEHRVFGLRLSPCLPTVIFIVDLASELSSLLNT
ncbi:hypothetical protein Y032_0105g3673 [Ancylostoma ceylanicum]|uniref:Uncharacterized protein n=1 Tax=Ancylostoma ceylanicum TaxID=53326 RepID=A0A016TG29_9BILA|nr:hypothetical protein Y032_0105g3673 [Ancylostoma ceylanicum]